MKPLRQIHYNLIKIDKFIIISLPVYFLKGKKNISMSFYVTSMKQAVGG